MKNPKLLLAVAHVAEIPILEVNETGRFSSERARELDEPMSLLESVDEKPDLADMMVDCTWMRAGRAAGGGGLRRVLGTGEDELVVHGCG